MDLNVYFTYPLKCAHHILQIIIDNIRQTLDFDINLDRAEAGPDAKCFLELR